MIATAAGSAAGPVGAAAGATVDLATLLYKLLNRDRHAENLKPNDAYGNGGSFPGHNPDGTPMPGYGDPSNDPWQYANFSMPPSQTGGINGGANTPSADPRGTGIGNGIGGALGKIGSTLKGHAGEILPWAQLGAGVASNLASAHMQSSAVDKQNQQTTADKQRLYALADEEQKRRNAMIQQLLPLLGRDMNSPQLGSMLGAYGGGG